MSVSLLFVFFVQLFIFQSERGGFQKIRLSFVKAAVVFALLIFLSTEALSFFTLIDSRSVALFWLAANLLPAGYFFHRIRNSNFSARAFLPSLKNMLRARAAWTADTTHKLYFAALAFIYSVVFIIALAAPPNTDDSMTYHMARVANWAQNGSVAFYPTQVLRQLYNVPLAEYSILHLQLLAGTDRFANLAQFFCFAACGVASSLNAARFEHSKTTKLLAAVLTATLPMAILQGSSTQTDLVVSFFVAAFFYFFSQACETEATEDFLFAGLALGLALLSKGTAYFYCFPIGVLFTAKYFFKSKEPNANKLKFASRVCAVWLLAFALSGVHFVRSYELFGAPLSTGEERLTNERLSAPIVFSNLVRNYAVHLGMISEALAASTENAVKNLVGAEINNRDSTYAGTFYVPREEHEDSAGNTIHLLLLTAAVLFAFARRGGGIREKENLIFASLAIVAGFLIYCAVMKWQPWASRLHLPLFVLGVMAPDPSVDVRAPRLAPANRRRRRLFCRVSARAFLRRAARFVDGRKFAGFRRAARGAILRQPAANRACVHRSRCIRQKNRRAGNRSRFIDRFQRARLLRRLGISFLGVD